MTQMQIWWMAIRPATLIASIAPVCIGTAIAYTSGYFSIKIFSATMLFALAIQIGTNFTNDFVDFLKGADTEKRKGPTRVTQARLVSVSQMQLAAISTFFFAGLTGSYLVFQGGGFSFSLLVASAIFLGYIYTAGPFPLAYLGLGELFILPFFGPIATGYTYFLQTGSFSTPAFLAGLAPGSLSCAILAINNLRDYAEDTRAKKKTLVVQFGTAFGQLEYRCFLIIALITPLFIVNTYPKASLALFSVILAAPLLQQVKTADEPLLPKTAKLLLVFTFLFCMGILL